MIPEDAHPKKKYNSPNYEKLLIDDPYQMVIKYCQKQDTKNIETYKFALLTYKNITISADKIMFDRNKKLIDAVGSKDFPLLIRVENCIKERKKFKFTLNNSNLSDIICKTSNP